MLGSLRDRVGNVWKRRTCWWSWLSSQLNVSNDCSLLVLLSRLENSLNKPPMNNNNINLLARRPVGEPFKIESCAALSAGAQVVHDGKKKERKRERKTFEFNFTHGCWNGSVERPSPQLPDQPAWQGAPCPKLIYKLANVPKPIKWLSKCCH